MKVTIKTAFSTLAIVLSAVTSALSQTGDLLPSADDVVAKMLRGDVERRSELRGYTALRRYVAVNQGRRAVMVVRVDCTPDGAKQFTVISEEGSSAIRKHALLQNAERRGYGIPSRDPRRQSHHTRKLQIQHGRPRHFRHRAHMCWRSLRKQRTDTSSTEESGSTRRTTPSFASKASLHEIRPSGCITCISFTRIRELVSSGLPLPRTARARSESLGVRN